MPSSVLSSLFGPDAYVAEGAAGSVDAELYPEELDAIRNAVPSRRAEFGTARLLARQALERAGFAPVPIRCRGDRLPIWPPGAVGSITHTHGHCAVVVGRRPPLRSLGLDIELLGPVDAELPALILTPSEHAWVHGQDPQLRDRLAITLFCAKEAFYKCQYALTAEFLEFGEVEITFGEGNRFVARILEPSARALKAGTAQLEGKFAYESGRVLSGLEMREN
jgi:4'-phosphopantetheinyl transferase EntD